MRRHLEAAEFHQAQPPGRTVGRVELVDADLGAVRVAGDVDQQVAEDAVHQPRRDVARVARRNFVEGDFQFVQRVEARFVDARRLARRTDEQAREQIRERRMVLPEGDQALEQIGPAQERTVGRRRRADDDVIAAAGAGVPAVEQELLGAEAREARFFVQRRW